MVSGDVIGAALMVALTMSLVCSWPMYKGWKRRERYELVRDTPEATPATARAGDTVLLSGPVRSADGVTGPVSGERGALAAWSLDEWQESTQLKYWSPTAYGLSHGPLHIEDDAATVTVPARDDAVAAGMTESVLGYDAVIGFDLKETLVEVGAYGTEIEVPQGDAAPDRLRELEASLGIEEPSSGATLIDLGRTHGTRRYREARLDDGDEITVRGTVTAEGTVVPPEDGPAMLSTLSPGALARRYRWTYWKLFYGMMVVIAAMTLAAAAAVSA